MAKPWHQTLSELWTPSITKAWAVGLSKRLGVIVFAQNQPVWSERANNMLIPFQSEAMASSLVHHISVTISAPIDGHHRLFVDWTVKGISGLNVRRVLSLTLKTLLAEGARPRPTKFLNELFRTAGDDIPDVSLRYPPSSGFEWADDLSAALSKNAGKWRRAFDALYGEPTSPRFNRGTHISHGSYVGIKYSPTISRGEQSWRILEIYFRDPSEFPPRKTGNIQVSVEFHKKWRGTISRPTVLYSQILDIPLENASKPRYVLSGAARQLKVRI